MGGGETARVVARAAARAAVAAGLEKVVAATMTTAAASSELVWVVVRGAAAEAVETRVAATIEVRAASRSICGVHAVVTVAARSTRAMGVGVVAEAMVAAVGMTSGSEHESAMVRVTECTRRAQVKAHVAAAVVVEAHVAKVSEERAALVVAACAAKDMPCGRDGEPTSRWAVVQRRAASVELLCVRQSSISDSHCEEERLAAVGWLVRECVIGKAKLCALA